MGIFRGTGGTGDSTTDTTVTTVTEKAAEAASSATSAADSATSAANSASSASTSETNAATSETNAATSATNSATSATNSATSATSASTSATTATTKASEASTSATNAATSATAAQTAQTAAEAAQTAAETAETNAETAEANTLAIFGDAQDVQDAVDDAEKLAINPEDSQYTLSDGTTTGYSALHHAAKAEDHKTAAEVSKNAAETAETAAETAQGLAETAKTAAETAQSAAETAQAAAELAQSNAETVYDDFDDRYLGTKSGDPLVDNDNEGLTTGTLYFNTTENEMRVYTGTAWVAVVDLAGDITVNSLTSNNDVVVKGNLEVQGTTITVDSATAQTIDLGDNDKIRFGDGDDLQVYHDGTDSYIANTTGTLKLSGNTDVTGNITVSGTVDGRDIAADGATLDAVASTYVDVSGDTLTGDLAFGDNVKAKFGASDDLQIYHSGSNSFITDASGTGFINIRSNAVRLASADGLEILGDFVQNGAVTLYYDNSAKLATTSTGVDVTGTLVSDGLTVDGNGTFQSNSGTSSPTLTIKDTDTASVNGQVIGILNFDNSDIDYAGTKVSLQAINDSANLGRGSLKINTAWAGTINTALQVGFGNDISFYSEDSTSQDFYWDASTSRLGLGTTSPDGQLDVRGSSLVDVKFKSTGADSTSRILLENDAQAFGLRINGDDKFRIKDETADAVRLTIDTSGNVGIGTTSPSAQLELSSATGSTLRLSRDDATVVGPNSVGTIEFYTADSDSAGVGASIKGLADGSGGNVALAFSSGTGGSASEAMRIDSTGNVGIGTTSPEQELTVGNVSSSASSGLGVLGLKSDANHKAIMIQENSGAEQYEIGVDANGALNFYNSGSSSPMVTFEDNNDVSFYNSDLSAATFRWDSSTSRLGIGTTSPSHELVVADSSAASAVLIKAGGTSQAQLYFSSGYATSDTDVSIRSPNTNILALYTSGSEAMRIDSSGRLGIGTTSPTTPLSIERNVTTAFDATGNTGQMRGFATINLLNTTDTDDDPVGILFESRIGTGASGGIYYVSGGGTNNGRFAITARQQGSQNSAEILTIKNTGNVGIGTTSPATALDVNGTVTANALTVDGNVLLNSDGSQIQFENSNYFIQGSDTFGYLRFNVNGSEAARFRYDGRLGIGTTSPDSLLNIKQIAPTLTIQDSTASFGSINSKIITTGSDGSGNPRTDVRYLIGSDGNAFTISYGATPSERMRIDSSGRVGIGTTSPSAPLQVKTSSSNAIRVTRDGAEAQYLELNEADGSKHVIKAVNGAGASKPFEITNNWGDIRFRTSASSGADTEVARIDSSGRLGIGTTSPSYTLTINKEATVGTPASSLSGVNPLLYLDAGDEADQSIVIKTHGTSRNTGALRFASSPDGSNYSWCGISGESDANANAATLKFYTSSSNTSGASSTERMRIDSSGNLLVGTTSEFGTNGISLRSGGQIYANRDNFPSGAFNREGTDGAIVNFSKGGSNVGSITCTGGRLAIGNDDTGLKFSLYDDSVMPFNVATNANRDAAIDLGMPFIRFKDLYLSGGVYLGGTGANNLLDDYDHGTFVPVLADATSGGNESGTTLTGRYVKVGSLVYVQIIGTNVNTTGLTAGNHAVITGLPFAVQPTGGVNGVCSVWANQFTFTGTLVFEAVQGTTYGRFVDMVSGSNITYITVSDIADDVADFKLSLTYRTDS